MRDTSGVSRLQEFGFYGRSDVETDNEEVVATVRRLEDCRRQGLCLDGDQWTLGMALETVWTTVSATVSDWGVLKL